MLAQQQRDQLEEQGFLLLVNFSTAAEMDELQEQIEDLFTREGEAAGNEFKQEPHSRRLSNLVNKGEIFRRLISQPDVMELVRIVLGEQYKLSSLNARSANPRQPTGQPLHADMGAVADASGPWVCNIIWLVTSSPMKMVVSASFLDLIGLISCHRIPWLTRWQRTRRRC